MPWSCTTSSSTRSDIERLREQVGGGADVEAGGAEVHGAARVRRRDQRLAGPAGAPDSCDLAIPDLGRELGLQRVVRATGATAQPVVVRVDGRVRGCKHR